MKTRLSRRTLLGTAAGCAAWAFTPYTFTANAQEKAAPKSPNERWRIGCIGMRYQGSVITREALPFGDVVAICDVDRHVREQARASFGSTATLFENYVDLLARKDIDIVLIGTPDHWHAKMLIDACRAGKDVYCEKPLTLTVAEGQRVCEVVHETGRVVQVGTWQRSDARFRLAVEMVQAGRIGKLQKMTVVMGKNKTGGPFSPQPVPGHFNWNLWQGQTPDVPYLAERSHYTFRWWYEYSGGEMTDTGAHHLDIAQWGAGLQHSGPVEIEGTAKYRYANGVELEVLDSPRGDYNRDGIMFEGDAGRLFVNRGTIVGKPVEELAKQPFGRGDFRIYAHDNHSRPDRQGKIDAIKNHMGNFYDCTLSRQTPISDVVSQHRSVSMCHLGNIAMRIGGKLTWNPETEHFTDSPAASKLLRRDQRKGFEIG
jgi:myo-inositol 2-dehydrogenase/D-chiro-inositol 1-dehydrogenase